MQVFNHLILFYPGPKVRTATTAILAIRWTEKNYIAPCNKCIVLLVVHYSS